jgi:hypothetical protein
MTTIRIVSRYDSTVVLFECEAPEGIEAGLYMRHALEKAVAVHKNLSGANLRSANLRSANLSDANLRSADLSDANLSGADLSVFRADFWDVLLRALHEIAGVRSALVEGRIDGSAYSGECACLVGTIGNVRGVVHTALGNGLKPDVDRPAEQWFMSICKGDTPETNQASKFAVEWLDELVALLAIAKAAA